MLNVVDYDNDGGVANWRGNNYLKKYPYVYVHTMRSTKDLLTEIDRIAKISGEGKKMPIGIYSDEYWPLPWYFRNHVNETGGPMVGFHGRVVDVVTKIPGQRASIHRSKCRLAFSSPPR